MASAQPARTISLSGSDWFIHEDEYGSGERDRFFVADVTAPGWIPARVPGNIQADLEAAHHLKPLWYGAGDARLADVAKRIGGIAAISMFRLTSATDVCS